jgi:hypothetical protein
MTKEQRGDLIKKLPILRLQTLALCDNFLASVRHTASGLTLSSVSVAPPEETTLFVCAQLGGATDTLLLN